MEGRWRRGVAGLWRWLALPPWRARRPRRMRGQGRNRQAGRTASAALAFDAYGTLFDVFSVTALCDELFPGQGSALAQLWRTKQLQYSLLRSLMHQHRDFWRLTEDGLVYASKSLELELTPDRRRRLMEAYLTLTAFPDVRPGLETLKRNGIRLAILSNGEPTMLAAAAKSAGIAGAARCDYQRRGGEGVQAESAGLRPRSTAPRHQSDERWASCRRTRGTSRARGRRASGRSGFSEAPRSRPRSSGSRRSYGPCDYRASRARAGLKASRCRWSSG